MGGHYALRHKTVQIGGIPDSEESLEKMPPEPAADRVYFAVSGGVYPTGLVGFRRRALT
jgi:hypothetical protein